MQGGDPEKGSLKKSLASQNPRTLAKTATNWDIPDLNAGQKGEAEKVKVLNGRRKTKTKSATVAADNDEGDLLAFTCISGYPNTAKTIQVPSLRARVCVDSLANRHYCPDCLKFRNYRPIKGQNITTADGQHLKPKGLATSISSCQTGQNVQNWFLEMRFTHLIWHLPWFWSAN